MMSWKLIPWLMLLLRVAGGVQAHPSDVSQMRVRLEPDRVQFRLSLNLLTLSRIAVLDADHNQRITPQEIATAVPAIIAWLKKKVLVSLNETETDLGDFQRYEGIWPNSGTVEVTDQEASQRYVDFNFVHPWPAGVKEVWTGFQIFAQVGDQHVVQALYQQQGQPDLPVEFSQAEPEYLYDTGLSDHPQPEHPAASGPFYLRPGPALFIVGLSLWVVTAWLRKQQARRPHER